MKQLAAILFFLAITPAFTQGSPLAFFTKPQKGIQIVGKDSLFSMQFQFRMQNRAAMLTVSDKDLSADSYEMRVRRLRLKFEGFLYDPRLTYKIQLSFARGDMDWDGSQYSRVNTSVNVVRDAVLYYSPNEHWKFGFGQTKLPGNRQRVISSGDQQFADRSIVNATFNFDRDFGFSAAYSRNYFNLTGAISSGEGRNSNQSNSGLAFTGRAEILPFGKFTGKNDYIEGDLEREQKPKVSIGGSYTFNQKALRNAGTLGIDLGSPTDIQTMAVDGLLKFRGFSFYNELMARNASSAITFNSDSSQIVPVYVGFGFLTQAGYLFKSNWEIAARFAQITPYKAIYRNDFEVNQTQQQQLQIGVTKYLYGHRLKVQGNLLYHMTTDMLEKKTTARYGAIFQVELGI